MTTELYTNELKGFLHSVKWPKGLVVDVATPDNMSVNIVLYRDNFETFSGTEKLQIAQLIGETINAIRKQGCPCYMEVRPGNGKQG
jgi:hypothetical protein